jgi:hypothetical protein
MVIGVILIVSDLRDYPWRFIDDRELYALETTVKLLGKE